MSENAMLLKQFDEVQGKYNEILSQIVGAQAPGAVVPKGTVKCNVGNVCKVGSVEL